jgi:cytidylate kinase
VSSRSLLLVLDGHDGSGKSTLARKLSERIAGDYVRAFSGAEGEAMLEAAEAGRYAAASRLARRMLARALKGSGARRPKVLDRHWMTVFSLVPEEYWDDWLPLPPTVLCFADLKTTLVRVSSRDEAQPPRAWHVHYLRRYRDMARRFHVPILRTDRLSKDESLEWLSDWASRHLSSDP